MFLFTERHTKHKIYGHSDCTPRWYLHLVVVEGLVSSSNPESYAGGSFATSRISQAGQGKRVGTRRREKPRRRELRFKKNSSDAGSRVISNDLKRRANDA